MDVDDEEVSPTPSEVGLLAALIDRSRLYRSGNDYVELMEFIGRMRHMAPFNAALLHMQKPGLQFAATDTDWNKRFNRQVKEGARPLLIMWPFSPVALVYDVEDTDGPELPLDIAEPFRAQGDIDPDWLSFTFRRLRSSGITCQQNEYAPGHGGHVRVEAGRSWTTPANKTRYDYQIRVNAAHDPNVQFGTLAHELGHLFLGHLGRDEHLRIKCRSDLTYSSEELEAESVSYLVCLRQGVVSNAEAYLAHFMPGGTKLPALNVYAVTQAAGRIEQLLGLATKIDVGVTSSSPRSRSQSF